MVQSVRRDRARCIRDRNPIARPRFFIPRGNARAPVINRAGRGRRPMRKTAPGCGRTPQRGGWRCAPFAITGPVGFTIGGGAIWVRGREPRQQTPTEPTAPHAVAVCTDAPPRWGGSPPKRRPRRWLLPGGSGGAIYPLYAAHGGGKAMGGAAPPPPASFPHFNPRTPRGARQNGGHQ